MNILILFASVQAGFVPIPHWKTAKTEEPVEALSCDKYMCAPPNITFADNVCSFYDDDVYYLKPCEDPDKPNCYPRIGMNSTCIPPFNSNSQIFLHDAYPGEICRGPADCKFGDCVDGKCNGLSEFDNCVQTDQCNPGLRCHNNACSKLLGESDYGCHEDYDCMPNLGCNKTDVFSSQGTCIPYFSIEVGGFVSSCDVNYELSDLCSSGYCKSIGFLSDEGQCIEAAHSTHVLPYECESNVDCSATNGVAIFEGTCQCGYNVDGQSYCQAFPGDSPGLNFLSSLKSLAQKGVLEGCNTKRRFADHCWKSVDLAHYVELEQAKYYYVDYAKLVNNDVCVMQTWAAYYWQPNWAVGLVVSLVMIML